MQSHNTHNLKHHKLAAVHRTCLFSHSLGSRRSVFLWKCSPLSLSFSPPFFLTLSVAMPCERVNETLIAIAKAPETRNGSQYACSTSAGGNATNNTQLDSHILWLYCCRWCCLFRLYFRLLLVLLLSSVGCFSFLFPFGLLPLFFSTFNRSFHSLLPIQTSPNMWKK